ncbi:hypothetical protein [Bauldia sp.]|uniref:hypothetical protein n=1 Tax=Bauldia sp. TaxID=2575872 RepID=UPI003BAD0189
MPSWIDQFSRPDPAIVAILEDPDARVGQKLRACSHLVRFGEIATATKYLLELIDSPGARSGVEQLLAQCQELQALGVGGDPTLLSAEEGDRHNHDEDTDLGFWTIPRGADTTVLAFAGHSKRIGVSAYFMERILRRQDTNVVFLFDWRKTYYLGGVKGLGSNVNETVQSLTSLLSDMGTRKLICLGQSAGGYAALRYGSSLSADGVLAFSPTTHRVVTSKARLQIREGTGREADPYELDLSRQLRQSAHKQTKRIVFGAGSETDVESAKMLSGLPGVVLQPVPENSRHEILSQLVLSGEFSEMFDRFYEETGPGRWSIATSGDSA